MKKRRKRSYNHKFRTAVLAIIITAAAFIYVDLRLRPAVITVAQYHIQSLINKAVNNAIISVMDKTQYSYDDLVEINRNSCYNGNAIVQYCIINVRNSEKENCT